MSTSLSSRTKANELLSTLAGKTISSVRIEGHHGDILRLVFTDGFDLTVCTYAGTIQEHIRSKDDVFVAINGKEIT